MKILFLNPHLYESPILGTLRGLGVATIVCSDLRECELVFKLHASSVSIFIGHDQDGLAMNEILKQTPRFARIPVVLTTSKWTDQQCIEHQATPFGANAYLRMPVDEKDFIHVVDQILSTELSHGKGFNLSDDLSGVGPLESSSDLELAPAGGGISLVVDNDKTSFTPVGISLESAPIGLASEGDATKIDFSALGISNSNTHGQSAMEVSGPPSDGITLQTELGSMPISSSGGMQIEDGAAVYGQATPSSGVAQDSDLVFHFDSPDMGDVSAAPAVNSSIGEDPGHTKEFRIEGTAAGESPIASEILATPIEATSIDNLAPIGDDQPTRVATPIQDFVPALAESEPVLERRARAEPASDEIDPDSLAAMPYLSRGSAGYNPMAFHEPMDDAMVPGGAAHAPDSETLKKYLFLREQDVTALSAQLRQAREQIGLLDGQLRHERAVSSEFAHLAQEQDRRIDGFEKEKAVALESAQKEFDDLKFDMKRRTEKIRVMELQVKEATEATERLKERVRHDIRKIRTREKELENRLEIMKKDSEALLASREQKIIELKRKLDLMEFNTDLVQELLEKERQTATALREKLAKAAQMMRVAGGLLGPEEEAMLGAGNTGSGENGVNVEDRTTAA
jgi:CheY-like chemotaxis protein